MKSYRVLIPAFNPGIELLNIVRSLVKEDKIAEIIIVNDGSESSCRALFQELESLDHKVTLFHHEKNQGKGAALKTGFRHVGMKNTGVVTADADGQHRVEDILHVGRELISHPETLILGTRQFYQGIPWRSQFGNRLTIWLFQRIIGKKISDTQSGLRGIPCSFFPWLLKLKENGYEFELKMLIHCCQKNLSLLEIPIETIYQNHNKSSHFRPILDSLKIYRVLFFRA